VQNSVILSTNGLGVLGVVGEGDGLSPNLTLFFQNSTIDVSGPGNATGILIEAPSTGVAFLGVFDSTVTAASTGSNAIGIQLLGTGAPCGCYPTIGALVYDSLIDATGLVGGAGPSTTGIDISASGSSFVALDMQNTVINSTGMGVSIATTDDAFIGAGISDGSQIASVDKGINVTSDGTDGVQIGVFDSTIVGGIYLTEAAGSTLDAFVSANTISLNPLVGTGLRFEKSGNSTQFDMTDNIIFGSPNGVYVGNSSSTSFTMNVTGNTIGSGIFGLVLDNLDSGDITANINDNTISGSAVGILFSTSSTGAIHVNPLPTTLEKNTILGTKQVMTLLGILGPVDGSIDVNGATVVLPATVP
jgi:hypothetical protein